MTDARQHALDLIDEACELGAESAWRAAAGDLEGAYDTAALADLADEEALQAAIASGDAWLISQCQ